VQHLHGDAAHLPLELVHGRQRGRDVAGEVDVVKPDDAACVRNAYVLMLAGQQHARGHPPLGGDVLPDQTVRVLFSADVASTVQAASSVHVIDTEHRPDGRLLMTLRVHHEREVLPWLLSWGADAYVVEPDALRRRLAQEAQRVADQYREAPTLME